jgi:hypothetical protein
MGVMSAINFVLLAVVFLLPALVVLLWNPMPHRERFAWSGVALFCSWVGLAAFLFYALARERTVRSG